MHAYRVGFQSNVIAANRFIRPSALRFSAGEVDPGQDVCPKAPLISPQLHQALLQAVRMSKETPVQQSNAPYIAYLLAAVSQSLRQGVPEFQTLALIHQITQKSTPEQWAADMAVDTKTKLSPLFYKSLDLALTLHAYQERKGSQVPYLAHLLNVTSIVLRHGGTETEASGAVLHDAVEDQGGEQTANLIRQEIGPDVADIVVGCSDTDVVPKPPWKQRKEAHIKHVSHAPYSVGIVVAADKLDNTKDMIRSYQAQGEEIWTLFKGGKAGTLWYVQEMLNAFKAAQNAPPTLIAQLDKQAAQLEALVQ